MQLARLFPRARGAGCHFPAGQGAGRHTRALRERIPFGQDSAKDVLCRRAEFSPGRARGAETSAREAGLRGCARSAHLTHALACGGPARTVGGLQPPAGLPAVQPWRPGTGNWGTGTSRGPPLSAGDGFSFELRFEAQPWGPDGVIQPHLPGEAAEARAGGTARPLHERSLCGRRAPLPTGPVGDEECVRACVHARVRVHACAWCGAGGGDKGRNVPLFPAPQGESHAWSGVAASLLGLGTGLPAAGSSRPAPDVTRGTRLDSPVPVMRTSRFPRAVTSESQAALSLFV